MKFIEGCVANLATNRLGFTYVKAIYSYCISPFFSCNLWEVVFLAFKQFNAIESQQLGKKNQFEFAGIKLLQSIEYSICLTTNIIDNSLIFQHLYLVQVISSNLQHCMHSYDNMVL